ncbi:TetR/AcrR family transcriptional regulator [Oceanirhabdus sp. W0125-5]|uniref:TetR/AcrR family transcriptional regulator n=1 Tax=Oceanirhabdus sp. W0125-5 TaxID=2999116 RepID=UPI0022F2FEDF|nr:TetR/AcrR family transcriptional regulator [Oceanirhabdus sp. W0125-5]WBW95689.1 TetR/AcrR family transcriptional regulator [Oceanirhabdus sp. W0125-5]
MNENKRQKIIRAAIGQIAEFHYSKVTIDGIVKSAEIPKGSFYQYFENKDDLYTYLFTDFGDRKLDLFESLKLKITELDFKQYMIEYIKELKMLEFSNDQITHLKKEFLNECPQHIKKEILKIEMPKSLKAFKEVIEAYVDKGEFRKDLDAKIASYVMVMSISNLEHYDLGESEDIIAALMGIIDFLVESMS